MKIGLRAGHSPNCIGAVGIVNEHEQMKLYYEAVKNVLYKFGHTIIDCNSNANTPIKELEEGATKSNNNNVDLFVSLHMNASNGQGNGTEAIISNINGYSYSFANNLCNNFTSLGFVNRGVKTSTSLYEMNHVKAPNIIFEICFCDSKKDISIYNQYSWEQLAYTFANAIDKNIPKNIKSWNFGWNKNSNGWWYSPDPVNKYYYKDEWKEIKYEWYSFDSDGYARKSVWIKYKGAWYYLKDDSKMAKKEWLWIDGECYCFGAGGKLYVSTVTPDGYTVDESGAWVN